MAARFNLLRLLIVLLLFTSTPALAGAAAHFPGDMESRDPQGRYLVFYNALTPDSDENHDLLLKELRTGNIRLLYTFDRNVSLLWAPDGGALALTDWTADDQSDVLVALPEPSITLFDLSKVTQESLGDVSILDDNDHLSFEAVRWLNPTTLLFRIHGHGNQNPKGSEEFFVYRLGGQVSMASPKEVKDKNLLGLLKRLSPGR
ncbi:MAG TPA: hypothetical protein VLY45_07370 [Nitrospiria bacterium]|nr:hypothetical protein [Nitrospiria bacterium]